MSSFTADPIVRVMSKNRWQLYLSYTYDLGFLGSGRSIWVPVGFITDFASTPRAVWWLVPPFGRYTKAALLHDYLYASHLVSRIQADDIFLEAMLVLRVPRWKAKLMWAAVRLFGRRAWANGAGHALVVFKGEIP